MKTMKINQRKKFVNLLIDNQMEVIAGDNLQNIIASLFAYGVPDKPFMDMSDSELLDEAFDHLNHDVEDFDEEALLNWVDEQEVYNWISKI